VGRANTAHLNTPVWTWHGPAMHGYYKREGTPPVVDRAVADMSKPRTRSFLTVHGTEIEMNKQAGTIDWRNIFDNSRVFVRLLPLHASTTDTTYAGYHSMPSSVGCSWARETRAGHAIGRLNSVGYWLGLSYVGRGISDLGVMRA
jgi:hypothetical protein